MAVSIHCQNVIEDFEDNPKEYCHDFRKIRSAAACFAWKYFEEQELSFKNSMSKAWIKVKEICGEAGAAI